jgi:CubicO group peptidase (beta-lactamase class C family)
MRNRTRDLMLGIAVLLGSTLPHGLRAQAGAPPTLPPGRAGDAVRAYVTAMDAADSAGIKAWLTRYDPEGDLVVRTNRQLGLARRTGGFTLDGVVRSDENALEAILRERKTGVQVRLELELNANGIAETFGLQPVEVHAAPSSPGTGSPGRTLPRRELVARLRSLVDSLAKAGQFSGVVSLSKRGAAVFERAYGDAERTRHTPNTLETGFNVGSINKLFTTIAIRQLAADGRLNLDSSLAKAWPDYPSADVARKVTLRQILEHTSGITGNIFALPGLATPGQIRHNRQVLAAIAKTPLAFTPGSRNEYSNAGFVVLGGLIERVSGEDYYAYIQKHVYAPAGMTRSGHFVNDSLPARTAIGYTRGGPGATASAPLSDNTGILPGRGTSAGGGYTTLGDLKRFLAALRSQKIPAGPPPGIGIAGGSPGVNAIIEGELPGEYDLIILSNFDPPSAERIASRVREWLGMRD